MKSTIDSPNRIRDAKRIAKEHPGLSEEGRTVDLYSRTDGIKVATGYVRMVYGDHGPYIELLPEQLVETAFTARIYKSKLAWYNEWHAASGEVKAYLQKQDVSMLPNPPKGKYSCHNHRDEGYADYKVGMVYISPDDLRKVPLDGSMCEQNKEIMTEKSMDNIIDKIHLGKWENVMPTIPDGSVDCIITSPPYNVDLGNNKFRDKDKGYDVCDDNMPYKDYLEWMSELFRECNRVLKTGGRLCINIGDGANGSVPTHVDFTYRLLNPHTVMHDNYEPYKMITTIVWDKNQIGSATAWGSWQSPSQPSFPTQFEFIIVVGKGTAKHEGDPKKITVSKENFMRNSRALWTFLPDTGMMKKYDHPATFPEELPRRLIDQLTYRDDVVLDPFSGSGTTCTVAKSMERHYIGIEMSEKYHLISSDRVSRIAAMNDGKPKWMQ